jgi:NAD(P)H-nitrite reductase large subunit
MQPDDELCLCFHVSLRKVINFLRITRPRCAAQLSECQGAGTGCGWCRPFLDKLFQESVRQDKLEELDLPEPAEYARERAEYRSGQ